MSAEHDHGHSGESITDIIATLFLCFLGIGVFLDKITETIDTLTGTGGGHGGH
jgi:hypothetical protein